jgi:hypothetical protein
MDVVVCKLSLEVLVSGTEIVQWRTGCFVPGGQTFVLA